MLENDRVVEPTQQGAVAPDDGEEHIGAINEGVDHLVDRVEELRSVFSDDGHD